MHHPFRQIRVQSYEQVPVFRAQTSHHCCVRLLAQRVFICFNATFLIQVEQPSLPYLIVAVLQGAILHIGDQRSLEE